MKRILISLFGITTLLLSMVGCSSEPEGPQTYTIASRKGTYIDWTGYIVEHYIVKENPKGNWIAIEELYGMKYELGYEYVVEGDLVTAEEQFEQDRIMDANNILRVFSVISKEEKETDLSGYRD